MASGGGERQSDKAHMPQCRKVKVEIGESGQCVNATAELSRRPTSSSLNSAGLIYLTTCFKLISCLLWNWTRLSLTLSLSLSRARAHTHKGKIHSQTGSHLLLGFGSVFGCASSDDPPSSKYLNRSCLHFASFRLICSTLANLDSRPEDANFKGVCFRLHLQTIFFLRALFLCRDDEF